MSITIGTGITVGTGISLGGSGGGGGTPGVNNVTGYLEMGPPVIAGTQLEDGTATINGSVGFTINDDTKTGIAIGNLSVSNQTWFNANYSPGNFYTCIWGSGSTVASSSINVVAVSPTLVFYIQGQSGAATYNYPFTFST